MKSGLSVTTAATAAVRRGLAGQRAPPAQRAAVLGVVLLLHGGGRGVDVGARRRFRVAGSRSETFAMI